jgi:hypothetical protein
MSFCGVSESGRSSLTRLLLSAALPIALMITSAGARAQVVGADGENGADCFTAGCVAGNGGSGESVTAVGTAIGGAGGAGGISFGQFGFGGSGGGGGSANASGPDATAIGGGGGDAGDVVFGSEVGFPAAGGDATATSNGPDNATSSATGGVGGNPVEGPAGTGGNATATSTAVANGSHNATASATATGGGPFGPGAATAITAEGGLAQAQAQTDRGESASIAKTTFGGVSVQSTVLAVDGSANATAQASLGQSPANPGQFDGFAFSTALPNTAYATALIGSANNVADALLGPGDKIFGTAILGGGVPISSSSTFDFNFRGDLILGVIADGGFDIIVNGIDIPFEDGGDNSIINLGSLGPDIDLTIEGDGVFAIGGAVPEPSTWAMMLLGFAGLGFVGYRSTGGRRSSRTVYGALPFG